MPQERWRGKWFVRERRIGWLMLTLQKPWCAAGEVSCRSSFHAELAYSFHASSILTRKWRSEESHFRFTAICWCVASALLLHYCWFNYWCAAALLLCCMHQAKTSLLHYYVLFIRVACIRVACSAAATFLPEAPFLIRPPLFRVAYSEFCGSGLLNIGSEEAPSFPRQSRPKHRYTRALRILLPTTPAYVCT